MPQFQIVDKDGVPALTKDGVTALPGAVPIKDAYALLFDDGKWPQPGEDGYDPAPITNFLKTLPAGYRANCMGPSPSAEHPAVVAERAAEAERFEQAITDRVAQRNDPVAFKAAQMRKAIEERHAAEVAAAQKVGVSAEAIEALAALKDADLADLDAALQAQTQTAEPAEA